MNAKDLIAYVSVAVADTLILGISIYLGFVSALNLIQGEYSSAEEIFVLASLFGLSVCCEKVINRRFPENSELVPVYVPVASGSQNQEVVNQINKIITDDIAQSRRRPDWLMCPNYNFGGSRPLDVINSGRGEKVLSYLRAERSGY